MSVEVHLRIVMTVLLGVSFHELASVAAPTKLNGPLAAGGDVSSTFQISPDGSRVAYFADQDTNDVMELYSNAVGGGSGPAKLNGPLTPGGNVVISGLEFSPNGDRILYLADQGTGGTAELYVVPSGGGQPVKLNGPLVTGGDVSFASLQFSPDGSRVLYTADQQTNDLLEIFSVPSSGGAAVKLNGALVSGGAIDASSARFSANGSFVTYLAAQEAVNRKELFRAPSGGGASIKLSGSLVAGGDVTAVRYGPTGARVGYLADQTTDDVQELYSVPVTGGTPLKMNPPLTAGGVVNALFSPNESRMLYAVNSAESVTEVYSVPSGGGTAVKLNGPLVASGDVSLSGLGFSPDSSLVMYLADQDTNGVLELYCAPAAGGTAVKLSGVMQHPGGDVESSQFSADSAWAVYRADQEVDEVFELFSVPAVGGQPIRLNAPLAVGGDVIGASFTADGQQVVYLADQEVNDTFELFVVPRTGGMPQKLSGPLTVGGDVTHWQLSPDGQHVVYRANQDAVDMFELYSVSLTDDLPGDYNHNGRVDAADYTVWRDGLGAGYSTTDYGIWKANFSHGVGGGSAGSSSQAAVPESASGILLICAGVSLASLYPRAGRGRTAL